MAYTSLKELLRPYKQSAIAEETGARAATVHKWYHGESLPEPPFYVALARVLRITVEELADIVAEDSKRRALARVSERTVA